MYYLSLYECPVVSRPCVRLVSFTPPVSKSYHGAQHAHSLVRSLTGEIELESLRRPTQEQPISLDSSPVCAKEKRQFLQRQQAGPLTYLALQLALQPISTLPETLCFDLPISNLWLGFE